MNNILGLDIGIGSVGTFLLGDDNKIKYMGVRIFESADEASDARKARSQRRNLKRKKWRKEQLKLLFSDFNVISKDEMSKEGFFCFETNNSELKRPIDKTVYHLRLRALNEKVSKREVMLCLYNILHARGHFLMETIEFDKENIKFEDYKEFFYETINPYVNLNNLYKEELNKILEHIFKNSISSNELKSMLSGIKANIDEEDEKRVKETLSLITGYKAKLKNISDSFEYESESVNINDLKSAEEINDDFLVNAVELYDLMKINTVMKDANYLCEVAVKKLDEYEKIINNVGSEEYVNLMKEIENNSKSGIKHKRALRNLANGYPNGLYVKEATAILRKQQEFYPELTNEFIDICASIISARIPYFVGPLDKNAKNAWIKKNHNFKYSYEYSKENLNSVNEAESIKTWINRMRSRCTYLQDCYALPTGSFLSETYNILNELNILSAVDSDGNDYYLTKEDKIKIFDNLFLKNKTVTYGDIKELLDLKSFGTKANDKQTKFNNVYTLYLSITNILPELKLSSIANLKKEKEKVSKIEDIILNINLFNEEKTKIDYFEKNEGYTNEVAKKLSKLKSKSFCSYSKEFISETPMNKDGETLIDLLFDNNTASYTNEQMTLITNATDKDGNHVDYISNKYERRIIDNNGVLDYNLLVDDDKPIMPISRPVLRALNECLKVYSEIVKVYGCPSRTVVETARDFPDFSEVKQVSARHFEKMDKYYDFIEKQLKDQKYKAYNVFNNLDDKDNVLKYLSTNKDKIELYITQMGTDILTGDSINLNELENYEIDHILPRGFGDDSMNDKVLIKKKINSKKDNRLPLVFINSGDCRNRKGELVLSSDYIKRVNALYDMKLISEQKYKRLMLEDDSNLEKFINQNLVDTRYIIREFMSIIKAYNKYHQFDNKIVALKSTYTSVYRKVFNIDKDRGFGDQHHALDAAMLVVADRTLSTYYRNYDERKITTQGDSAFNSYNEFLKDISLRDSDSDREEDLKRFIKYAYRKAFNEDAITYKSDKSVINQIKSYKPYYSLKTEKNWKGQYFDINPIKQEEKDDKQVLSILGINNDKKVFSGVNCVAVDFYKFTNAKGKKEHLAVHIPLVIVDNNGNINQEMYKKLIIDHYKKPELLDGNGNIKDYYFRFRAFKNDLIYEDASNVLLKFNIGSIVNKKLECKFVNVFSYNEIYNLGNLIRKDLVSKFNIKTRQNPDGIPFSDINKVDMIKFVAGLHWENCSDDKIKTAIKKLEKINNLYNFSNDLAYLTLIINRPGTPPTIDGQYKPVINSNLISGKDDTQYIKLKYNILGVRSNKVNDTLIIETPKVISGSYKKITKEKFSWKISKYSL